MNSHHQMNIVFFKYIYIDQVDMILYPSIPSTVPLNCEEIRNTILTHLTTILGGDNISALYLFYHILSGVYDRNEFQNLGNFPLNIFKVSDKSLVSIMQGYFNNILPRCHVLHLNIDNLNISSQYRPEKDFNTDRIIPSIVQCFQKTHFILDETEMQTGILNSKYY